MGGLVFEEGAVGVAPAPGRADVACFVGLVAARPEASASEGAADARQRADLERRAGTADVRRWLAERGWAPGARPHGRPEAAELRDVPVPVDAWEVFDRLFAWEARDLDGHGLRGATYLGAAVRSFFAQGGRRCYVVAPAAPLPQTAAAADREALLARLVPGYPHGFDPHPADPRSWRGVGHLFGLPDVSIVCLPDLADLVAEPAAAVPASAEVSPGPERFVECSEGEPARPAERRARLLRAPRVVEAGFVRWARAVRLVADVLARPGLREAQLVAALPLPADDTEAARDVTGYLERTWLRGRRDRDGSSLASAFVQLAWPWARTPGGDDLPERLESPDGVLAGVIARTALTRGAFRSAAGQHLADVYDLAPALGREALRGRGPRGEARRLDERVSLLGPTPRGLALLSDVTTDTLETYRPAAVSRLVSLVVRAARQAGEESVFEPSGERLWAALRRRLTALLGTLWAAGALRGATAAEAFDVRCDRSTTTGADLDAGRVIVEVRLAPSAPVETIRVLLALEEGGRVSARAA